MSLTKNESANSVDWHLLDDGFRSSLLAAATRDLRDVIITDIRMPVMSGLAAAGKILVLHPHARIIVSTVRNEPAIIEPALSGGVQECVTKTAAGDELIEAVQAVLSGGRYISSFARAALANRSRGDRDPEPIVPTGAGADAANAGGLR